MRPIPVLRILFLLILAGMIWVTVSAGMTENVFSVGPRLRAEPWWIATLWDAYCGFLTFYVWVFYRERGWAGRAIWFVLIMCLGNIAMAVYMLIRLLRLPVEASWEDLLLREPAAGSKG